MNKCLFLIENYDDNKVLEYLLIDNEDAEKVYSAIEDYDNLDDEEKNEFGGGVDGALEYLKQKGIKFETLDCKGLYAY